MSSQLSVYYDDDRDQRKGTGRSKRRSRKCGQREKNNTRLKNVVEYHKRLGRKSGKEVRECVRVWVCVRERKRDSVCVCVRERERETACERERKRERERSYPPKRGRKVLYSQEI